MKAPFSDIQQAEQLILDGRLGGALKTRYAG